jgi:hypothetical protein
VFVAHPGPIGNHAALPNVDRSLLARFATTLDHFEALRNVGVDWSPLANDILLALLKDDPEYAGGIGDREVLLFLVNQNWLRRETFPDELRRYILMEWSYASDTRTMALNAIMDEYTRDMVDADPWLDAALRNRSVGVFRYFVGRRIPFDAEVYVRRGIEYGLLFHIENELLYYLFTEGGACIQTTFVRWDPIIARSVRESFLSLAAKVNNGTVPILLELGAPVNTPEGIMAFNVALNSSKFDTCRQFLDRGFDLIAELLRTVETGIANLPGLEWMLRSRRGIANKRFGSKKKTLLMLAIERKREDSYLEVLLRVGSDPRALDSSDKNCFDRTRLLSRERMQSVRVLLCRSWT